MQKEKYCKSDIFRNIKLNLVVAESDGQQILNSNKKKSKLATKAKFKWL